MMLDEVNTQPQSRGALGGAIPVAQHYFALLSRRIPGATLISLDRFQSASLVQSDKLSSSVISGFGTGL